MRILVLTKRQYMRKDLIDDRFGRFREIPLELAKKGHRVQGLCLSYACRDEGWIADGPVRWKSINAGKFKFSGLFKFVVETLKLTRNVDVIWACSDSFYGVIGCWAGRLYGIPVVFDIYDNFGEFFVAKLPIAKQLYHWAIRRSDAVTCLSEAFGGYLEKVLPPHRSCLSHRICGTNRFVPPHGQTCLPSNLGSAMRRSCGWYSR